MSQYMMHSTGQGGWAAFSASSAGPPVQHPLKNSHLHPLGAGIVHVGLQSFLPVSVMAEAVVAMIGPAGTRGQAAAHAPVRVLYRAQNPRAGHQGQRHRHPGRQRTTSARTTTPRSRPWPKAHELGVDLMKLMPLHPTAGTSVEALPGPPAFLPTLFYAFSPVPNSSPKARHCSSASPSGFHMARMPSFGTRKPHSLSCAVRSFTDSPLQP